MGLTLITPPTEYPVTRTEAKTHCRIDGSDEDALVDGLIAAASEYVEQYTGRSLLGQTWKLTLDEFSDSILLPRGPVQSATVKYYDASGVEQTASTDLYTLDAASDPAWIVRNDSETWPGTLDAVNVVSVTFIAGYETVPVPIKQAILLLVAQWYDDRTGWQPHVVDALLANYRAFS